MMRIVATEDANYKLETSRIGMWVFLAMETMFFGGALFLYWSDRHFYPEAFAIGSAHLKTGIAALNTAILLTSSFTMASAVHWLSEAKKGISAAALGATALLGVIFIALKVYEYVLDARDGILPGVAFHPSFHAPREIYLFFSLYFLLTALHALHLTIGVVWCGVVAMRARHVDTMKLRDRVDILGLYWHFVDVVWVLLLPLFYLIGAVK